MIGVGKLGLPCAEVMAQKHHVEGFDVAPANPSNFRMVGSLAEACHQKDIIFVAVPTPHDPAYGGEGPTVHLPPRNFDYSAVTSLLGELNNCTKSDQVVALISTVLPGTTRREFAHLAKNYRLVYNPYLIALGSVKWDMVNPEMIIVGTADGSRSDDVKLLDEFYRTIVQNNPRIVVGTWEEAESIKIFYNTFISAKVSLVNMIQDISERIGNINVDIVTDALKQSAYRITGPAYMTAGMGDGGPCHPRDNIALRWLAEELKLGYDLFGAVMTSREMQAENLARRLDSIACQYDLDQIWIYGKAYKPEVAYTAGSYSLLVAHYLKTLGRKVSFVDPLTNDLVDSVRGVILLAHKTCDCPDHTSSSCKRNFYCNFTPGSVVVDPWRRVTRDMIPGCVLIHYGNTRRQEPAAVD